MNREAMQLNAVEVEHPEDMQALLRATLDAFADGTDHAILLIPLLAKVCADSQDATWTAIALCDQYHRRGKISAELNREIRQTLERAALRTPSTPNIQGPTRRSSPDYLDLGDFNDTKAAPGMPINGDHGALTTARPVRSSGLRAGELEQLRRKSQRYRTRITALADYARRSRKRLEQVQRELAEQRTRPSSKPEEIRIDEWPKIPAPKADAEPVRAVEPIRTAHLDDGVNPTAAPDQNQARRVRAVFPALLLVALLLIVAVYSGLGDKYLAAPRAGPSAPEIAAAPASAIATTAATAPAAAPAMAPATAPLPASTRASVAAPAPAVAAAPNAVAAVASVPVASGSHVASAVPDLSRQSVELSSDHYVVNPGDRSLIVTIQRHGGSAGTVSFLRRTQSPRDPSSADDFSSGPDVEEMVSGVNSIEWRIPIPDNPARRHTEIFYVDLGRFGEDVKMGARQRATVVVLPFEPGTGRR